MNETMNPDTDAILALLDAHQGRIDDAAYTLGTFLDDPAAISSPTVITACNDIIALSGHDDDPTAIAETLMTLCEPLAKAFCADQELCPIHICDIDICHDDH